MIEILILIFFLGYPWLGLSQTCVKLSTIFSVLGSSFDGLTLVR